jgi:mycothiol synthase
MDGKEAAGAALCRLADSQAGPGLVARLAVRRPWRKRGIGGALLQHAFAAFYARGMPRISLGVDGESLTGAQRLYESAGMSVTMRIGRYEKEVQRI